MREAPVLKQIVHPLSSRMQKIIEVIIIEDDEEIAHRTGKGVEAVKFAEKRRVTEKPRQEAGLRARKAD